MGVCFSTKALAQELAPALAQALAEALAPAQAQAAVRSDELIAAVAHLGVQLGALQATGQRTVEQLTALQVTVNAVRLRQSPSAKSTFAIAPALTVS